MEQGRPPVGRRAAPVGADFANVYAAGRLVLAGTPAAQP
jgi:hypothetical protein